MGERSMNRRGAISLPQASWYWTWGGASLGYRQKNGLYLADGLEIGRFVGNELYGPDGHYLGETGAHGEEAERLVRNRYKVSRVATRFTPSAGRARQERADLPALPFYLGQEDFPLPGRAHAAASAG